MEPRSRSSARDWQPRSPSGGRPRVEAQAPAQDAERGEEIGRTLELIERGGPFPYRQDGVVFGNREGRLPPRPYGYYHEFTVRTPGATTRGARRIVTGAQGERFYSDDHYRSFTPLPAASPPPRRGDSRGQP